MGETKISRVLTRVFNALFCIVFSLLFLEIVFRRYGKESGKNLFWADYKQHLGILAVLIVITAAALLLYRLVCLQLRAPGRLRQHESKTEQSTGKKALVIIFTGAFIILLMQITAAYLLWTEPINDANLLHRYGAEAAVTGRFDFIQRNYENGDYYLIQYPNNFLPMLVFSLVYRIWYLIFGSVSRIPMLGLNVLSINSAILMTALLARKTCGDRKAFFVLGLCALFVPYYTYTSYVYTDTLSIPYGIGAVLLTAYALEAKTRGRRYLLYAFSGAAVFIGFKLKGSIIVAAVAVIIYLLLKLRFKQFICAALVFVIAFAGLNLIYSASIKAAHFMTEEQSYEREFPATHWIMMGLHGHGGFSMDDNKFTKAIPGKNEKREANLEVIKEDIKEMGADGLLQHWTTKAVWAWGDGTYYISGHIDKPIHQNILHDYVLDDGVHHYRLYAYCCGFQLFLILMMALSSLKGFIKPRWDMILLIRLSVFGVFLFLMLWEIRSRYLFNFTPFYLFLAADGVDSGVRIIGRVKEMCRSNEESYEKTL